MESLPPNLKSSVRVILLVLRILKNSYLFFYFFEKGLVDPLGGEVPVKLAFHEPRPCPVCRRIYRDAATLRTHTAIMHTEGQGCCPSLSSFQSYHYILMFSLFCRTILLPMWRSISYQVRNVQSQEERSQVNEWDDSIQSFSVSHEQCLYSYPIPSF